MADLSNLTPEQRAVVDHPVDRHGRVLAGPGTGKSFTAMMLLARLAEEYPGLNAKMLTFSTRGDGFVRRGPSTRRTQ